MKHILLSILTLTCMQSYAQNITGIHTLRIDDKVEKQLVEYELNDESAMNMVWYLRDLSDLDEKHQVVYTDVRKLGTLKVLLLLCIIFLSLKIIGVV